jgi:endonuclease/exonuclease/phosphatase family metal-dependent hydrolase
VCISTKYSELVSSAFFDEIIAVLEQLLMLRYPVVLCGDFNIQTDDPDDSVANRFHHLLESFDCIQHVAQPTHTAGHIFDLIIARSGDMMLDTKIGRWSLIIA